MKDALNRTADAAISRYVLAIRLRLTFGQYFDKMQSYSSIVGFNVH